MDSTSQALAFINQTGLEPGIITYYRQEAARALRAQSLALEAIAQRAKATPEEGQE